LIHQDDENGGIADRAGDVVDVFHTFFGIAGKFFEESFQQLQGLSLTGYPNLAPIDPSYALCHSTLKRMGLLH